MNQQNYTHNKYEMKNLKEQGHKLILIVMLKGQKLKNYRFKAAT